MIDIKKAYEKAKEHSNRMKFIECVDIGESWAFYFDDNPEISAGLPYITINKITGDVDFLFCPPFENLELIQNGKRIKL